MDVPGYEEIGLLGTTATASTHVARSTALGVAVVVKVLRDDLAQDSIVRDRLLAGAALQARCAHTNVVRVVESGRHGTGVFVVTEYLRGGDLLERLRQGMRVRELAGVLVDLARAVDFVHAQGVVHLDIKPANVLFRDTGQVALGDFGIALETGTQPDRGAGGTVLGTPAYMSPEQAAGAPADPRSDIYALGALLFEALAGAPPFGSGPPDRVAERQVQDPVPRLPAHLEALQPVVDRALAKVPAERFASAGALAEAFGERVATTELGTVTLRSDPVDTLEIRAVGGAILAAARRPRDPVERPARWRDRTGVRVAAGVALMVLFIGWLNALVDRSETATRVLAIVGLVRDPAVQAAWDNARALHRDPNQSLATVVAGYRRVLSIDPRDERAQASLDELATEWKRSIERALAQGNVTLAENRLAEYLLVFPSDPQLAELSQRITDRRTADTLVNNALAQLRAHGLGDSAATTLAIRSYQEVLRLVPEHPVAQMELDVLAEHYTRLAAQAAAVGDLAAAIGYLDRASAANVRLPLLASVRAQILGDRSTAAALDALLAQAASYRASGALIDPPGANAAELYHRVLATDPGNAAALAGIDQVVDRLIASISEYLTAGDLVSAGGLVARASEIGLDQAAASSARERLTAELERFNRVVRNLEDAATLLDLGFITEPVDRNAVLLLREVQQLDPDNKAAAALMERSAGRLADAAQEAYGLGMKNLGRSYLALALSVTPDRAEWQSLQERWDRDD